MRHTTILYYVFVHCVSCLFIYVHPEGSLEDGNDIFVEFVHQLSYHYLLGTLVPRSHNARNKYRMTEGKLVFYLKLASRRPYEI